MGFFNSLKGQLGRDTGRAISNKIYGDRHATKYQRVGSSNGGRANSNDVKAILREEKKHELKILEKNQEYAEIEHNREQLKETNLQYEKDIANIISIKIPQEKEDLIDSLHELSIIISANPWKSVMQDENKIANRYVDAVYSKYIQHLHTLKIKYPLESEIIHFEFLLKKIDKDAFRGKYSQVFLAICFFIVLGIGSYLAHIYKV
ncbi:MAG TPA: hypothetical protein VFS71_15745 [Flavobacterium sp.]|uniref:hypothetical protein n=1 Tax=Flavobacterium sp. TaxID=239 RepID=UPI002DBE0F76|nr:hypothetical protein [Flavobacterium sp.]HEU4791140.1 hypothetical protein [Flavobacterium sp.]